MPRKVLAAILAISGGAALLTAERAASAETLLQRGAYLTESVAACGRCHTPRDGKSLPIAGMEMAGGTEFDDADLGHVVAPNTTPDRETGIGRWTQAQIVDAIRNGVRPDGTIIGPPMPFSAYDDLSDRDANAIAAYLRTIKPIRKRAFAGGRRLHPYGQPGIVIMSRNISPDKDDGIGKWSDAEIKRATTAGIRPDGTRLSPAMPYPWYKNMAPADLDAMVAYLRTVAPQKNTE